MLFRSVIGAVCFVGGTTLLIIGFIKARRKRLTEGEYTPTYAKISHYGEAAATAAEKITPDVKASDETEKEEEPTPEETTEEEEEEEEEANEEEKDVLLKKLSSLMNNENTDKE